jgi:V/A-type H+-transporting ATPase subunit E
MALRDLLTALEEEGAAEHKMAQQDRRRQADQILAEARERGAKAHEEAVTAAETVARHEAEGLLIAARSGARRAVRTARDDALEVVLEQVREQLLALPGSPSGAAAAGACADEALAAMPHATTLRVHPADAATLRPDVAVKLVADLETGGAITEDNDGRYIDNTYLTRLANTWPETRAGLSRSWDRDS